MGCYISVVLGNINQKSLTRNRPMRAFFTSTVKPSKTATFSSYHDNTILSNPVEAI